MKAGRPLDNGSQGATTNEVVAKMAGVSPATIKKAKAVQGKAPDKLEKVAKGEMSIKTALKSTTGAKESEKLQNSDKPKSKNTTPVPSKPLSKVKAGDKVFSLQQYEFGAGDITVLEHVVRKVEDARCHFEDGSTKSITAVYDLNGATLRRQEMLKTELESVILEADILRKAIKQKPPIQPAKAALKA